MSDRDKGRRAGTGRDNYADLVAENRRLRNALSEAGPMPNLDPEPIGYAPDAFASGVPVSEWVYDAATNTLGPPK
jgi:hypothetical protein